VLAGSAAARRFRPDAFAILYLARKLRSFPTKWHESLAYQEVRPSNPEPNLGNFRARLSTIDTVDDAAPTVSDDAATTPVPKSSMREDARGPKRIPPREIALRSAHSELSAII
jgi:hypothetical protein